MGNWGFSERASKIHIFSPFWGDLERFRSVLGAHFQPIPHQNAGPKMGIFGYFRQFGGIFDPFSINIYWFSLIFHLILQKFTFSAHFGGIWSDFGAFWGRIFSQFRTKRRGQKWAFLDFLTHFPPFSTQYLLIFLHFQPILPIFTHSCPIFTQIFPYFQPISIQFSAVFVQFSPNFQPILTQNSSPKKWKFGDFQSMPQKFTFSTHLGGIWSDFRAFLGQIFSQFHAKILGQK